MSILGLTIDYGPFGFLDHYDPNHICNASGKIKHHIIIIIHGYLIEVSKRETVNPPSPNIYIQTLQTDCYTLP